MVYATTVPDYKRSLWKILGMKKGGDDSRGDGNSAYVTGNKDKVSMLADRFL